jgi:hypothetical protein
MIQLPTYEDAGQLALDVAGQFLFEADARQHGMKIERSFARGVLSYRFLVGVPGQNDERQLRVDFDPSQRNLLFSLKDLNVFDIDGTTGPSACGIHGLRGVSDG